MGDAPNFPVDGEAREPWAVGPAAVSILVGAVLIASALVVTGFVLTRALGGSALLHWDERVVASTALHRTSNLNRISLWWSRSADAPSIVAVAVVVGIVSAVRRRYREGVWLAVGLAVELGVFLTVSYSVHRPRPDVDHLGSVPGTGSFPSGHVAATIVLYGTIAVFVVRGGSSRTAAWLAAAFAVLATAMVGWSRVYRGMHHPLDVAMGVVLGVSVLLLANRSFGDGPPINAMKIRTSRRKLVT